MMMMMVVVVGGDDDGGSRGNATQRMMPKTMYFELMMIAHVEVAKCKGNGVCIEMVPCIYLQHQQTLLH